MKYRKDIFNGYISELIFATISINMILCAISIILNKNYVLPIIGIFGIILITTFVLLGIIKIIDKIIVKKIKRMEKEI